MRNQALTVACNEHWDVIVIGGGITGAGILREAARRNSCQNKLKQLSVAFQNHHDVQKNFPLATWTNPAANGVMGVPQTFTPTLWSSSPGAGSTAIAGTAAAPQSGYS